MNEKIKQLADKARFVSTATPPTQDEILEKFAELIVLDIVRIAEINEAEYELISSILKGYGLK
jgi:hypothetical protein